MNPVSPEVREQLVLLLSEDLDVMASYSDQYIFYDAGLRTQYRILGDDDVPRVGRVAAYADKTVLEYQTPRYRAWLREEYPELDDEGNIAAVDVVESVRHFDDNEVELQVRRYLIQE